MEIPNDSSIPTASRQTGRTAEDQGIHLTENHCQGIDTAQTRSGGSGEGARREAGRRANRRRSRSDHAVRGAAGTLPSAAIKRRATRFARYGQGDEGSDQRETAKATGGTGRGDFGRGLLAVGRSGGERATLVGAFSSRPRRDQAPRGRDEGERKVEGVNRVSAGRRTPA